MNVKIDTKEKFSVIYPEEQSLSANMSAAMRQLLLSFLKNDPPHVIMNLKNIQEIDPVFFELFVEMHETFYQQHTSLVWCEMNDIIKEALTKAGLEDCINITPTESEAWDILQMEEIERELLNDEEEK